MKYQYKIIKLDYKGEQETIYKLETEVPYTFHVGEEIWFNENWKYGETFKIKKI